VSLEPLTDGQREGVLRHLQDLVGSGSIDLERYELLTSVVRGAASVADLEDVMARVPPVTAMTPAARRLVEPLELRTYTGTLRMEGRWQVGKVTNANVATGGMVLDLTEAELDDHEIDLTLKVATGSATVIIPYGIEVQLVRVAGGVKNRLGTSIAPPGAPLLRLHLTSATGTIRLRRPERGTPRRWRRLLRR
jgi:hypothetical protein